MVKICNVSLSCPVELGKIFVLYRNRSVFKVALFFPRCGV